jgi:hypothetical protein
LLAKATAHGKALTPLRRHRRSGPARLTAALATTAALTLATLAALVAHAGPAAAYPLGPGYWTVASDGGIFSFGAQFEGSTGGQRLNQPIVGMASFPFLEGYWLVASDGGVFSFGSADFFGSTGGLRLNRPVVGMAAHASGLGYWLVASDGGIFSFGAAQFLGSAGGQRINRPVVGMAATPTGNGYWLVASDGGIFSYGDARFLGSTGGQRLNQPIVGMASTPSGNGYWLVASDGGIFSFGDAQFLGSTGSIKLNRPVVGMAATPTGNGYWLTASDGGIFAFGDATFKGSTGGQRLNQPVVGMAARPPLALAVDPFVDAPGRTETWTPVNGDEQLALSWDGNGTAPAGARVLGVEGLDVSQLGTIGFTDESGACTAQPRLNLYVDTDGDGSFDTTRAYTCANGGGGAVKSFNPVAGATGAPALSPGNVVTGIDVLLGGAGSVNVDDIRAAGITVGDFRTHTAAGTTIG